MSPPPDQQNHDLLLDLGDVGSGSGRLLLMASRSDDLTAVDPRPETATTHHSRIAPRGKHTLPGRIRTFFAPGHILIILTVGAALIAALLKSPCRIRDWGAPEVYFGGCYSDWTGLWTSRGFASDPWAPFRTDSAFEYPILIAVVASLIAWLAHGLTRVSEILGIDAGANLVFYDLNFLAIVALWIGTVLIVAKLAGIRYWDATMVAVAPGIIFAGFINWDMWAVASMVAAMWAFAKHRNVWAGVLIGLGTAVKVFPLFLVGAILVLAIRTARYYPLLITAAATAVTWLLVNLPMMLLNPGAWGVFYEFSSDRPPGWSSIWHTYATATDTEIPGQLLSSLAFWSFFILCAIIAVIGLTTKHRPRLAQLMFLIVAAFILVNKVYSPQFVLWIIPLLVLALPNWRDFLIFSAVELLHFWAIWAYLAGPISEYDVQHQLDEKLYLLAVAGHVVVLIYLMLRVVMDMYEPNQDRVRNSLRHADSQLLPDDDPSGAEFDGAPDRFVLRKRSKHPAAANSGLD